MPIDDLTIEVSCFLLGVLCTLAAMFCAPGPTDDGL